MKKSLFLFLFLLISGLLVAQEHRISVLNSKDIKLILNNFKGDLPIEGYSGNEIIITTESGNFEPPERAKGLKPVYPGGTDNTGIGLEVQKSGNRISVTCLLPITKTGNYKIKAPDNLAMEIESGCEHSSDISVINMKSEIDIKNCHDIDLKNVSGPLVLSTIAGDIDVTFNNITLDKPFSVNSISGDIDITLPAKTSTDLEMRTINGRFYSDFEITDSQSDLKRIGGSQLSFPVNGGGFKFTIVTVTGNVYLRKGN